MHFSIPDTQECTDHNGSNYTGYNIHLNGEYHCTVRYKQLFNLHEQLKKFSGSEYNLPSFPPKKYWPLTPNQVEDRRAHLEKYIQAVGQSTSPINLDLFYAFLLTAQQESTGERIKDIILDVYLMNGYKISVSASSNERSYSILEKACNQINLPNVYVYYFSLYLINFYFKKYFFTVVRKLQDFEAPYISQKNIEGNLKIMLRKSYWEPDYDLELMHDRVALNLLYVQTISDLERGWILCGKNTREQVSHFTS
ncbi:hypothetical protein O3M35_008329 [Rhynocoris fuscipes]|uniref:Uncharacterized protein n=1 Tax=Rhynocoris fuscipes TaxID=488301 RepID=A0AAW1D8J4_9HEMI